MDYKLFVFDDFENANNSHLHFLYHHLPEDRKIKVKNCFYEIDKKIKIIEYFILKNALGFKNIKPFAYSKNGKPFIRGCKKFNISHSKSTLAVAVSNNNIGVDIQEFIAFETNLAKHICSKKEYDFVANSSNPTFELTKLWVMKESLIKLKGLTIAQNLKTLLKNQKDYNFDIFFTKDGLGCVCVKKPTKSQTKTN